MLLLNNSLSNLVCHSSKLAHKSGPVADSALQ